MRMRSPRIAPPLNGELGSVATTATERSSFRKSVTSTSTSVDLPVPGAPVKPTTYAWARSFNACWRALTDGSRFSTRLIARARARTSPERNRSASVRTGSLSSPAHPASPKVAPEHDDQPVGLLAAGRGGARRRRDDGRGPEVARKPFGCQRKLPVGVIQYLRLEEGGVPDWIGKLQAGGVEHSGEAALKAGKVISAAVDLDWRLLSQHGRVDEDRRDVLVDHRVAGVVGAELGDVRSHAAVKGVEQVALRCGRRCGQGDPDDRAVGKVLAPVVDRPHVGQRHVGGDVVLKRAQELRRLREAVDRRSLLLDCLHDVLLAAGTPEVRRLLRLD